MPKEVTFNWQFPDIYQNVFSFIGRYILLSGGRSSGKSWFIAHRLLEEAMIERHDILCVRQFQTSIKQSSHKLFKNIIEKYNLPYTVLNDRITCDITKSEICFIGMEGATADSVKSYEDFDRVFVEEAQNFSIDSFVILDPTIRKAGAQLYFGYNPKHKKDVANHIKAMYKGKYLHIHSTYLDNPFTNQETIDQAEAYKLNKPDEYNHVWLGHYLDYNNNRVCPDFTQDNIRELRYLPSMPLYFTFDFNVNPNSALVAHKDSSKVYFIDEIVEPLNTDKMIKALLDRYPHEKLIVINGDASGGARKSSQTNGSDYDLIENELIKRGYVPDNIKNRKYGYKKLYRLDLRRANGSRYQRYQAWNQRLLNPNTGTREILIDPKCEKLIYNMEELNLKVGSADFDIPSVTRMKQDPMTMCLGHVFDAASYLINYYYPIESDKAEIIKPKTLLETWRDNY